METHDNTEDQESWMNDPEEVAIRILEDPAYFEARHPDEYAGLAKKVDLMALHNPGGFRVRIIQFLGMLPKMIREAREMPRSAKIVELARIEKAIRQIVIPPVPVHDDVWDLIQSREEELREYHLQVLGLMRDVERPEHEKIKENSNVLKKSGSAPKPIIGFDTYILEEHRGKLMPYLVENYTNASPEQCGFMLYALVNCGYVKKSGINSNQSALHRSLINTFGKVGTRQALNTAILRLDPQGSSDEDKRNIKNHEDRIGTFLKPVKTV